MIKFKITKLLSVVIVFAFVFSSYVYTSSNVESKTVSDLQTEYSQLEEQQEKIKENLSKTESDINDQIEYQKYLDEQIYLTQTQIEILQNQINTLDAQIEQKNIEIENSLIEYNKNYEIYKGRIKANYMKKSDQILSVILSAQTFGDFLRQGMMAKTIAEHDEQLLDVLTEQKRKIEEDKKIVEQDKQQVEKSKISLNNKTLELNQSMSKSVDTVTRLNQLGDQYQKDKARIDSEMAAVEDDIQKLIQSSGSGEYVGGELAWPVPGYTTITSYYGWRSYPLNDFHRGIDISGANIYGKNVVAANAGRVIKTVNSTSGSSYGTYLIIDHGGGLSTLYAHNSALTVNEGDWVKRGQVIAKIGSTGFSTGPHLHFEVRENGQTVDPLRYLK